MNILQTLVIACVFIILISSGIGYGIYERYIAAKEHVSEVVALKLVEFAELHPSAEAEIKAALTTDNFISRLEYERLLEQYASLAQYMK